MKTELLRILMMMLLAIGFGNLHAQKTPVDTTMVMNPANFIPHEDGYYLAGVDKDLVGDDGIPEHYDGCYDAYGDADHKETGEQNGWNYANVIIFRNCSNDPLTADDVVKGTQPEEGWPTEANLIQVGKHKYIFTDSASYGYISSPEFTSLSSLTVKVSTDLSINSNRSIFMMIEASFDGGETWEYIDNPDGDAFIYQQLTSQGGDIHTYTAGTNDGFDAIATASQAGPIMLRFLAVPPPFTEGKNGERLNFWEITINAKTTGKEKEVEVLANKLEREAMFIFKNETFIAAHDREISVYTLSGTLVGSGKEVHVCQKGLFIVKADNGITKKIYLK